MNKILGAIALCWSLGLAADQSMPGMSSTGQAVPPADCSHMGSDIQTFASKLSAANKKMFCAQFNDAQRSTAMQLASQQDASGKSIMTPNQSVQKVAADNQMTPPKSPTGCPVK